MLVEGNDFTFSSTWVPLEVPDSFVIRSNKLLSTRGNGEAKLYVGSSTDASLRMFFGKKPFKLRAFMQRDELIQYMDLVRADYAIAAFTHRGARSLPELWEKRCSQLKAKKSNIIWFDALEQRAGGDRCYLKGIGDYELLRSLPLPLGTKISINKYVSLTDRAIFEFRLMLDGSSPSSFLEVDGGDCDFNERERIEQEIISGIRSDVTINATEKESLVNSRIGQGIFREKLLVDCGSKCPISQITDARILRASHIKPWRFAKHAERLDQKNGLILAPTYDLLFDQGFITFEADKTIKISSQLSDETVRKLGLIDGSKFKDLPVSPATDSKRLDFLKYHKEKIFKP